MNERWVCKRCFAEELWASAIIPTEEGWNTGDREFTCHLHDEQESMLSGSQRGSGR